MTKRKKIIIGASIGAVLLLIAGIFAVQMFFGSEKDVAYVEKVSSLMGLGSGSVNRYAGIVETQQVIEVKSETDKKVKEVYVTEGVAVNQGDRLMEYDTTSINDELSQANIDYDRMGVEIDELKAQIQTLKQEQSGATTSTEKLSYTIEIQSAQNSIQTTEYDRKSKKLEIDKLTESLNNTEVFATSGGIVRTISTGEDSSQEGESIQGQVTIQIMAEGNYRVKSTINEQNVSEIAQGDKVLVYSRVDDNATFTGTIASINMDGANTQDDESGNYDTDDQNELYTSSEYTFYIDLSMSDGLLIGQHVYVELDQGQMLEQEGVWLNEAYIVDVDTNPYVWKRNSKGKIEKQVLVLGEYDQELLIYEVVEGLTRDDYIAFPFDDFVSGMVADEAFEDIWQDESYLEEEDFIEEEFLEETPDTLMEEENPVELGDGLILEIQ